METGIKVGDCMKTKLVTISEDSNVFDAAVKLKEKRVGCLLVTDGKNKIYAVLTDEDLVRKALAGNKLKARIKELCSKPLMGVSPDEDISVAAKTMGSKNVKRLVVFKEKEVVGIISSADIVRISPSLYDLIAEREHVPSAVYASTR